MRVNGNNLLSRRRAIVAWMAVLFIWTSLVGAVAHRHTAIVAGVPGHGVASPLAPASTITDDCVACDWSQTIQSAATARYSFRVIATSLRLPSVRTSIPSLARKPIVITLRAPPAA